MDPLIPRAMWRRRGVLAGVAGSFGITATTSTFVVVSTLYFRDSRGLGPAQAGPMILPFSFAVVAAAASAARLLRVTTPSRLLLGGLTSIGAAALLAAWQPSVVVVVIALALSGAGNGVGAVAAYALGTAVSPEQQAVAAGLLNTAAQLGTAIMVAIGVGIATDAGHVEHRIGWLTVVGTAILVCCGCWAATAHRDAGKDRPSSTTPNL